MLESMILPQPASVPRFPVSPWHDRAGHASRHMKHSHQRTARDLRGEAQIPAGTFRGAQTPRAGKNLGVGARSMPAGFIRPPGLATGAVPRSRPITDVAAELDGIGGGRLKRPQDPGWRAGSGLPEEGQG